MFLGTWNRSGSKSRNEWDLMTREDVRIDPLLQDPQIAVFGTFPLGRLVSPEASPSISLGNLVMAGTFHAQTLWPGASLPLSRCQSPARTEAGQSPGCVGWEENGGLSTSPRGFRHLSHPILRDASLLSLQISLTLAEFSLCRLGFQLSLLL